MLKYVSLGLALIISGALASQPLPEADTSWKLEYRETPTRINNLVHTRLDLKPDFSRSWLYGKAWITLRPHFYKTDSLTLDAKGMELKKLALVKAGGLKDLKYSYDELQIRIKLDKAYSATEQYTIYIEYIAKPDEYEEKYAANQMLGIKGMYFINPKGEEKKKPTQIWTQGETESSSAWFPTIDKTNQRCTQELSVTVDDKFVTLSNGKLVSQKKNADKTRTDSWKMDLPHAPYLFFLGVGEYTIVKDSWRGKEVNYYVEPEYGPVAKKIFGHTPEMMTFFSKITGVDYPWIKYSQITGRDYVAGAMENTTATIHQNFAQQDARELIDGNSWEGTIAHELFHQWFGDYVTTESWSNLTLNESFADYSQTLWSEYKHGQDAGDEENYQGLSNYLQSGSDNKDLVRFYYHDKEDMFDAVSYQKGGRILHMLRKLVGDDAFYKSINLYLSTYKFKSAEAHQLRLVFEEVTGRDLNWFFNQWYFGSGHPIVDIKYEYDDAAGKLTVIVSQNQETGKFFRLPFAIDIYTGDKKTRHEVWASNKVDRFTFDYAKRPELVNVDGDKILLWAKTDEKTLDNFAHQFKYAGNYVDRREALAAALKKPDDPKAVAIIREGLNDKYYNLRVYTLARLDLNRSALRSALEEQVAALAKNDPHSMVRAWAIGALGQLKKKEYTGLYQQALGDFSYSVSGAALAALSEVEPEIALTTARKLKAGNPKGWLSNSVTQAIARSGDESMFDELFDNFMELELQSKFNEVANLVTYLKALKNTEKFKTGVDALIKFKTDIPDALKQYTDNFLAGQLDDILAAKRAALQAEPGNAALKAQVEYLAGRLGKKAF